MLKETCKNGGTTRRRHNRSTDGGWTKLITCGTCYMASLFTSLSRTAITTIYSEAVLQTCQHQLPQALATSLLYTSSSCPSSRPSFTHLLALLLPSLMHFSQPPRLCQVHLVQLSFNEVSSLLLLGKPHGNFCTDYYARNQLLARNSTSNTQCTTPKVLAPHQGCSTAHRRSERTNDSSATSSYRRC